MFYPNNSWVQQNYQQLQPIQSAKPPINVVCYTVNAQDDMDNIDLQLNVLYIGINRTTKEIYTKQLNNSGLVDVQIYKQFSNKQTQENEILRRLEIIENKLGGINLDANTTKFNSTSDVGSSAQSPDDGSIQSTNGRKERATTNANAYKPSQEQGNRR